MLEIQADVARTELALRIAWNCFEETSGVLGVNGLPVRDWRRREAAVNGAIFSLVAAQFRYQAAMERAREAASAKGLVFDEAC